MLEKSNVMIRVDSELLAWLEAEARKVGLSRNQFVIVKLKELSKVPSA